VLKSKLNKKIVSNKNGDEIKKENVDKLQVVSAMDRILSNNGIKYFLNQETVQYIKDFDLICDSITIPLFISILYDADSTHRVPFILENYGVKQKKIEYLDGKIQHETYLYKSTSFSISYYYSQQDANHKDSLFLSGQFFTLERMKFKEIEVVVAIETSYNQNDNIHTTKNDLSKSELYECIRKDHINSFSKKIRYKNFEHKHQLVEDELSVIHELQEISLAILKETVRVCELLGLQYYLGEGTLLGAIRHSGFIPWDDDVDILMPRDDYDRFLALAPSYISGDYLVQHWTTTKPFFSIFTKVRYVGYSKFYQKQLVHITENSGPYIDIFPLDTVPHLFSKPQMKQKKRMRFLQRALSYSTKVADPPLKRYHIKIYGKLIPYDSLIKKISRQYIKFSNVENKYYTNLASWYGTDKETFPIEFFGKGRKVPFEDTELIVPDRAEDVLSIIYGDYLKLPPIRKRRNNHGFTIRKDD
jgi:lipopolysaccharide cholinephosphotransferase